MSHSIISKNAKMLFSSNPHEKVYATTQCYWLFNINELCKESIIVMNEGWFKYFQRTVRKEKEKMFYYVRERVKGEREF